jgi:putative membrane protein
MPLNIDHARINAAIARAETQTAGEITCVIKKTALDYPETPLMWAAASAFILPLIFLGLGVWPHDWLGPVLSAIAGWNAPNVTGELLAAEAIIFYALTQLLLFAAVYLLVSVPKVTLWLTPRFITRRRAHKKALEQFLARGLHLTEAHTGVMIFCALEERFVDVIADEGIYSRVDKSEWNATVAALVSHIKKGDLTTGFEAAVERCGVVLSAHFPPGAENPNESPDVLIEI